MLVQPVPVEEIIKQLMTLDTNSRIDVLVGSSAVYACQLLSLRNTRCQIPTSGYFKVRVVIRAYVA
jgi:hypothetical protein